MAEENRAFLGISRLEGNFTKGLLDARVREVVAFLFLDLVEINKIKIKITYHENNFPLPI